MEPISLKKHSRIDFHYFIIATLLGGIGASMAGIPSLNNTIMLLTGLLIVYRSIQLFGKKIDDDLTVRLFGTNLFHYIGFCLPLITYLVPGPIEKTWMHFMDGVDFIVFGLLLYLRAHIINSALQN